ncbi:hypothetical protein L226DRAFT_15754 [Lentinus tigrinus ALCF2SS1-7]|uniref:uncharacterized protein n=1 Tax=Lentinus tigrinus ALCF2SS1-7 TaxID=1328758 RepID=UPI0011663557|nr:hypothetical protein L226DRAFT_15754 [Lentinus tigrinus ALCF2SS1-7]
MVAAPDGSQLATMNCTSATRQAATHHILLATLNCFEDWKSGCCPVVSMLELVHAAVRILLIAAAGINDRPLQSVLAYLKELCAYGARRKEGASHEGRVSHPPHDSRHPRDREHSSRVRKPVPRSRRSIGKEPTLTPIPASPVASTSKSTPPATPPRSPERESTWLRQERSISRKRTSPLKQLRIVGSPASSASSETAVDLERTPRPVSAGTQVSKESSPPTQIFSESSNPASVDPSVASIWSGEPPDSPPRSVVQRIRSHHNSRGSTFLLHHFTMWLTRSGTTVRDRCLVRAQSIPTSRPSQTPRRRTDPYDAYYNFPTPMSPDAGTYLQEVVNERHGRLPANPNIVEQVRFASLPSSPNRATDDLPGPSPTLPDPARPDGAVDEAPRSTARRHRWSWHIPHFPERTRSADSDRNLRRTPDKEHKDGFPKFKFGHNRRYVSSSS